MVEHCKEICESRGIKAKLSPTFVINKGLRSLKLTLVSGLSI